MEGRGDGGVFRWMVVYSGGGWGYTDGGCIQVEGGDIQVECGRKQVEGKGRNIQYLIIHNYYETRGLSHHDYVCRSQ